MIPPPTPANENVRLQALYRLGVLDTPHEEVFDRITRLACAVADVPIALVSLVDKDRQWFKSKVGLEATETPRDISFCGHAILGDGPFVVTDAQADPRFADNPLVTGGPEISFYMGIPLVVPGGQKIGTLCVIDSAARELDAEAMAALQDLAEMTMREMELRRVAATDPLTGVLNRRMLELMHGQEASRSKRTGRPFSFAMLDLDHFKAVNDTHGHDVGDAVLVGVAETVNGRLREQDTLFRLGGEEFGVLYIDADAKSTALAADRVREYLAGLTFPTADGELSVTVSIGVAQHNDDDENLAALMARADRALYAAKSAGRNRVEMAD